MCKKAFCVVSAFRFIYQNTLNSQNTSFADVNFIEYQTIFENLFIYKIKTLRDI